MGALIFGILLALALFWAVGAHNRLLRLRAEVVRQWSSVDAVWLRLLVRMQGGIAARQSLAIEAGADGLQALQSASDDLLGPCRRPVCSHWTARAKSRLWRSTKKWWRKSA